MTADDDDWTGTPPEGRHSRDRANPGYWQRSWPVAAAAGAGLLLLVVVVVILAVAQAEGAHARAEGGAAGAAPSA